MKISCESVRYEIDVMYKSISENKTHCCSEVLSATSEISNVSEIIEERVNFVWKINKWSSIGSNKTSIFQPCCSPHLTTTGSGHYPSEWFFELRSTSGYLSLVLCKCEIGNNVCKNTILTQSHNSYLQPIKCQFKIVDQDGNPLLEADGAPPSYYVEELSLQNRVWHMENDQNLRSTSPDVSEHSHWLNFTNLEELFENRNGYICNNAINFEINFKIPYFHVSGENKSLRQVFYGKCQEALDKLKVINQELLVDNVAGMFLSVENSDFSINSEDLSFPVHKHIILSRCRKLYNVLTSRVADKYAQLRQHTDPILTTSALVSEVDPCVLKSLIEFIYKGSFSACKGLNNLIQLLKESKYYGLQTLKDLCFLEIIGHVVVANVASIILLAESYGAHESIKSYLYAFCQEHQKELNGKSLLKRWEHDKFRKMFYKHISSVKTKHQKNATICTRIK
ncbi:unnamed protein product [Allacma fusca]|uniref:BTB domain-containing protein n=1 Tax=Allacma fusca TaxID=39272 RepID=A0A8J2J9M5_9HEXA|nr:unnamed protein product [Allacma fusca]